MAWARWTPLGLSGSRRGDRAATLWQERLGLGWEAQRRKWARAQEASVLDTHLSLCPLSPGAECKSPLHQPAASSCQPLPCHATGLVLPRDPTPFPRDQEGLDR